MARVHAWVGFPVMNGLRALRCHWRITAIWARGLSLQVWRRLCQQEVVRHGGLVGLPWSQE